MKKLFLLVLCLPLLITPTSNAQESGNWQQVLKLGKGTIHNATWSPDGESIAVSTSTGAWIYDKNLENDRHLQPDDSVENFDVIQNPIGQIYWQENEILGLPGVSRFGPATRAYLWDAASGEIIHIFENAWGPHLWQNNLLLALPDNPAGLNVWSTKSGEQLVALEFAEAYTDLAFDGESLVAVSSITEVVVWNIETGEQIVAFDVEQTSGISWQDANLTIETRDRRFQAILESGELYPVEASRNVVFSPDGNLSAELVGADTVIVREGDSERFQLQVEVENRFRDSLGNLYWSADGSRLLAPTGRDLATRIYIWDSQTGELIKDSTPPFFARYYQPVPHPTENVAIIASDSGDLQIWVLETGDVLAETWLTTGGVIGEAFSLDNTMLATARALDNSIRLWNIETGKPEAMFILTPPDDGRVGSGTSVAFSPDGTLIAAGAQRNEFTYINVWNVESQELLYTLEGNSPQPNAVPLVISLEWSADGSRLLTHTGDINQALPIYVREWDMSSGKLVTEIDEDGIQGVFGAHYLEDDILLFGMQFDSSSFSSFIVRHSELQSLEALPTNRDLVISPFFRTDVNINDGLLLTMDEERTRFEFWDIDSVSPVFTSALPEQSTQGLSWRNEWIAAGVSRDNQSAPVIQLWQVDTDSETAVLANELVGHSGLLLASLAFNQDATMLATVTDIDEVIIWARD